MAYFRKCPHCGANLDPGETCDCVKIRAAEPAKQERKAEPPRKQSA